MGYVFNAILLVVKNVLLQINASNAYNRELSIT